MALFQASLVNPASPPYVDISTTTGCASLIINDDSNYSTNTSPSSALVNFSNYITVTVTHLPSGTVYTMQSTPVITPNPTLFNIPAPSTGTHQFSLPLITGDGAYQVVMVTIPTYDPAQATYTVGVSQVYNPTDGLIYVCIQQGAGNRPDISPLYWTATTNYGMNYTDIQTIYLDCELNQCYPVKVKSALCSGNTCNNLCENQDFIQAVQLALASYSIGIQVQANQAANTILETNLINNICSCT